MVQKNAKKCFEHVGLNYKKYLRINKKLLRKSKTVSLVGNTKKANKHFKFKAKTRLETLITIMRNNELKKEEKKKKKSITKYQK